MNQEMCDHCYQYYEKDKLLPLAFQPKIRVQYWSNEKDEEITKITDAMSVDRADVQLSADNFIIVCENCKDSLLHEKFDREE